MPNHAEDAASHENLGRLHDVFYHRSAPATLDVYICLPLSGAPGQFDLSDLLTHHASQLGNEHVMFFGYHILRGLKFLHSAGVVHGNLKPADLICNRECDLQVDLRC